MTTPTDDRRDLLTVIASRISDLLDERGLSVNRIRRIA